MVNMAPTKRTHVTLDLKKKCDILEKVEKGLSIRVVAEEFKIPKSTVYDIKRNKSKIRTFVSQAYSNIGKRKIMRTGEYPEMENMLYNWFLRQRATHAPISSDILKEKAKIFYEQKTGKTDFHASSGWLDKFKARYGIRSLKITGERVSSDKEAVMPFQENFLSLIKKMDLSEEQVYNCDESALFWRSLPQNSWVHRDEKSAPGRKMFKDRLTFMPCCNATGTHKLPLLILGKAKQPRALRNQNLPVTYMASNKGWMTKKLFSQWFSEDFKPKVRRFLTEMNRPIKALLVIDNAPSHPKEEELLSDSNFKILFLPPNCTPLLQPMDQELIANIKVRYKSQFLRYIVNQEDNDITKNMKMFNIKNAIEILDCAWKSISERNIKNSWKSLWPQEWEDEDLISLSELQRQLSVGNSDMQEIRELLQQAISSNNLDEAEVDEWVHDRNSVQLFEEEENDFSSESYTEAGESDVDQPNARIKTSEVLQSFSTCIRWAEENNMEEQDILLLKCLKDKALQKQATFAQKSILSFFKPQL